MYVFLMFAIFFLRFFPQRSEGFLFFPSKANKHRGAKQQGEG